MTSAAPGAAPFGAAPQAARTPLGQAPTLATGVSSALQGTMGMGIGGPQAPTINPISDAIRRAAGSTPPPYGQTMQGAAFAGASPTKKPMFGTGFSGASPTGGTDMNQNRNRWLVSNGLY
jgi:hypothetical protein